ncbi:MAG: GGDEF domain-containing protein [Myxococcales bacterium]|nr:GGDEF domain-containing protein [Myxococcales bacterium]
MPPTDEFGGPQRVAEAAPQRLGLVGDLLLRTTHDAVLVTDSQWRTRQVNDRYCQLVGASRPVLSGDPTPLISPDLQTPETCAQLAEAVARTGHWEGSLWLRHQDGQWLAVQAAIRSILNHAGLGGYVCCLKPLQSEVPLADRTPRGARLVSRAALCLALEEAAHKHESPFAVAVFNIIRFRRINDALGYPAGDALLDAIGRRLRDVCAPTDAVARISGGEFAVLLREAPSSRHATRRAQALLDGAFGRFEIAGVSLDLRAAAGLACFPECGRTGPELMQAAELALRALRRNNASQLALASPGAAQEARGRLGLEVALRRALDEGTLSVALQPKINAHTGEILGAEALARWHDPTHGEISPGRFIPLAEDLGLVAALDEQVWRKAAGHWARWLENGLVPGHLALNASPQGLGHRDLVSAVAKVLADTPLDPRLVILEVTEEAFGERMDDVVAVLGRLRALGLRVALDDFGIRHSNLLRLAHLPVDELKIDRSLVTGARAGSRLARLLTGIVALGHNLGMDVVVEGIETGEEWGVARAAGAHLAQGFLFSRPLAPADFEALVRRRSGSVWQAPAGGAH